MNDDELDGLPEFEADRELALNHWREQLAERVDWARTMTSRAVHALSKIQQLGNLDYAESHYGPDMLHMLECARRDLDNVQYRIAATHR